MAYDKHANLIKETLPNGSSTEYTRDSRGFPIAIKDALGNVSHLNFDLSGNLTKYTDALENSTNYSYDREGKLLSLKDALNNQTHYSYNHKELLAKIAYPDGTDEQFEYDEKNRLISHINQEGSQTKYELDNQGRVAKRVNALNHTLGYSYDQAGRVKTLINENGSSYNFEYDALDRLISETGVDGLITAYEYNPLGVVTQKTEAVGTKDERVTHFKRDKQHQLIEKEVGVNSPLITKTNYEYDIIGQLSKAINATAKVRLEYDALGRIKEERTAIKGLEEARVLQHEYDALGNRIKTTLPTKQSIEWEYNEIQQLTQVNLDGKEVTSYQRDALNQELSQTQGALETLNEYDSLGRLISQDVYNKEQLHNVNILNDEAQQQSRNYSYSKVGELLSIEDSRKGKTNYSYDRLGRVKETLKLNGSKETKELFNFDPAHNLLNDENDKPLKNNQIETYQDKRFKYDTFGNLINKKVSNHSNMDLTYNVEHQLIEAKVTKHKNTQKPITQTYNYTYDPFGRRATKTDTFGITYFTWDGNRLLTETRGERKQSYIYEQFGFTPIASTNSANNINYYHTDHLGTPQEVTNNQGEIIWEAEYATWGNTAKVSYKQTDANIQEEVAFQPLRFQGQYYDQETGLHYNRFRYYDPDIGRFISQDPIGLLGGTNLYQYAPNPVGWVDPLGLAKRGDVETISGPNIGTVSGRSTGAGGSGVTNPIVQELYDDVPIDKQSISHAKCVEGECLSKIANDNNVKTKEELKKVLEGSELEVHHKKGHYLKPCSSCDCVLNELGVKAKKD
ncbi:MAG: Rhs family protein [uncultured Sulfurovum sp.]|uniref:Rhs family protein n=1 Tax=uncultured Sulfurovum sp. TaxID=269237 RepID=A0A6S6SWT2_9BACT|nr:MAG: Rhs family protein [uncultured Sulfurovum sp.]